MEKDTLIIVPEPKYCLYVRAVFGQSFKLNVTKTSFSISGPQGGSPCYGEGSNEKGTVAHGTTEPLSYKMNEVRHIDSICNNTNVASQHIPQSAISASTIIDNGGAVPTVSQPIPVSAVTSLPTIANNLNTISPSGAPPMVFTVNHQQQANIGAPVLKLVSPVEGGAPQLIKVVPAVVNPNPGFSNALSEQTSTYTVSDSLQNVHCSAPTIFHNTNSLAVVQKMNDGQSGQSQSVEGATTNQRVYSIVTPQQKTQQQSLGATVINVTKSVFNNGQQRVHTLGTLPTNARVISANNPASLSPPKVQILSNVVVSKQNIVINKSSLQAQRQLISTITTQKTITSVPKSVMETGIIQQQLQTIQTATPNQAPKIQTVNNVVLNQTSGKQQIVNNHQKSIKTVNSMSRQQPQKTVKTLSPGSPQPGYIQKTSGVKTLSPNMTNHYNRINSPVKMMGQPPIPPRVGIKTLNAKNLSLVNRTNNMTPKPNYIGKHANQAQKAQRNSALHSVKNRGIPPQRQSPLSPKYSNQKSVISSQSGYNQAMSAQILSPGGKNINETGFPPAKNCASQHSPDHSTLSEDIGEEVRPDFSPSLSYLYQVVMLDHNYGAPPPEITPSQVTSRSSNIQHTSPVGGGGTLNGALLAAAGREREREKEREEKMAAAAYFNTTTGTNKRHGRLSAGVLQQVSQIPLPYVSSTATILPQIETRNNIHDDDAGSVISSEGHNDDGEGEETETAPEGEGDEDGVTRCICDFDHDDGYMISCDVCLSWQHVDCMGLDRNAIPEKYQCVRCQPRHVDRKHARSIQIRKREDFMNMGTLPRENIANAGPAGSGSGNASDTSSETSTADSTGEPPLNTHYGRHSTGKVSLNNNFVGKKRATPVSLSTRRKSEPASQNRRGPLVHKRQQRRESARETSITTATGRRAAALKKREKKVKVIKKKIKSRSSIDDDSQDSWHGVANAYSNTMGASLMQLRQWIENYEEAVTNHYSPELRARISNIRANGTHTSLTNQTLDKQAPATAQADVAVQKCKVSGQQLTGMKIVLASQSLTQNSPVIELRGKYMLSTQHRTSAGSGGGGGVGGLQTRQHSQRPGPFLFFYRLPRDGTEVCVDTRTYGNDARFIRRSCRPNAELRHLVEKGTLHLYVITISNVEKNSELTIKHESHDLAAIAVASSSVNNPSQAAAAIAAAGIQCACGGGPQSCGLYNNNRKNGGVTETTNTAAATVINTENTIITQRKRRGRRASTPNRTIESPVPPPEPSPPATITSQHQQQQQSPAEIIDEAEVVAEDETVTSVTVAAPPPPALSTRRASSNQRAANAAVQIVTPPAIPSKANEVVELEKEYKEKEERRKEPLETKDKKKKMTREERKLEAIMKAIERMEKADQRKQELQARQAQRKDADPTDHQVHQIQKHQVTKQENGDTEGEAVRTKRKKRKGRARTISTNSQTSIRRRTRVNSTDSYATSGDEPLLSPALPSNTPQESQHEQRHTRSMTTLQDVNLNENSEAIGRDCVTPEPIIQNKIVNTPGSQVSDMSSPGQVNTAAGLLLALANGGAAGTGVGVNQSELQKSPEVDGNSSGSNSSLQSSPSTPLSSACLLVAAAVGPLEPGFKFPKTKKAIMNEWLNKSPDPIQSSMSLATSMDMQTDSIQPQQSVIDYYGSNSSTNKSLATLVQAASLCDSPPQAGGRNPGGQGAGNAKKRWLRQAISEECDSPCSRPESPPGSSEMVAPPKKRRLARESLSSEQSFTPPTTPTMLVPPSNSLADEDYQNNDEEFYTNEDRNATLSDSSPPTIDDQIGKDTINLQHVNMCFGSGTSARVEYQTGHDDSEILKDQMDYIAIKQEDDIVKKYSEVLPTSLGRDPRPMFRDSAQLLGNIEKTIRFYEENLTGPVTVSQPVMLSPQPVLPASLDVLPVPQPVFPVSQLVLPISQSIMPISQPLLPVSQPVLPVPQTVLPVCQSVLQISQSVLPVSQLVSPVSQQILSSEPVLPVSQPIIPSILPAPNVTVLESESMEVPNLDDTMEEATITPSVTIATTIVENTPVEIITVATTPVATIAIATSPIATSPIATSPIATTLVATAPVAITPIVVTPVATTAPVLISPVATAPTPKENRISVVSTTSLEILPKKDKIPIKTEVITPAKRKVKLSISEYRQRKQLKLPADRSGNTTPERVNSPETPPPVLLNINNSTITTVTANTVLPNTTVKERARSRSLSTSSTSSLSSDEEVNSSSNISPDNVEPKATATAETQVLVAFNSAPTAVERQRENVERIKKAFGLTLDDETRRNALNNTTSPTTTSTTIVRDVQPVVTAPLIITKTIKSPPHLPPQNNTLTTSDLLAKIEPSSTTKLILGLESPKYSEKKFLLESKFNSDSKFTATKRLRSPSPDKIFSKNPSPEPALTKKENADEVEDRSRDKEIDEAYSKFDESVSQVYIPSFNNPVYPNSTQYTGFSSVIDTSPYEGRNPSPPPSELLKSTCYK